MLRNYSSILTLPSAPLWRRFAALLYDIFVLAALSMGYGALATALAAFFNPSSQRDYAPMFQGPLFFLGWLLLIVCFFSGFWWRSGQTIGMRAWHLRLVSLQSPSANGGYNPSLSQALLRCLYGLIGLWLAGGGYIYARFNRQGDCWQDVRTHTRVIVLPQP